MVTGRLLGDKPTQSRIFIVDNQSVSLIEKVEPKDAIWYR